MSRSVQGWPDVETAQRHVAVQSLARKTDGLIAFSWHDLVSKTHRGPSFARMAGHDKGTIRPRARSRGWFLPFDSHVEINIHLFSVPSRTSTTTRLRYVLHTRDAINYVTSAANWRY